MKKKEKLKVKKSERIKKLKDFFKIALWHCFNITVNVACYFEKLSSLLHITDLLVIIAVVFWN
jgi:hypothetical protein